MKTLKTFLDKLDKNTDDLSIIQEALFVLGESYWEDYVMAKKSGADQISIDYNLYAAKRCEKLQDILYEVKISLEEE